MPIAIGSIIGIFYSRSNLNKTPTAPGQRAAEER